VFNRTQFSRFDTAARLEPAGNQINSQLGRYTAALAPRRMQLALRLHFKRRQEDPADSFV
jgi:hypothetical protein